MSKKMNKEMNVTPWEVEGKVDYDRLKEEFGIESLEEDLLKRLRKHTGKLHYLLRRNIFFAHRDLGWLLDKYEKGEKFFLYTGRGPSGYTHLGHIIPWIFTKWLQDKFDAKLYFQITDDEKFLFKSKLSMDDVKKYAYDNILDIIALGFDPEKTNIFLDTEYSKTLYPKAIQIAKNITFSTVKATFGFKNSNNIGEIFFTSVQAVPAFIESFKQEKNIPCLIPLAVDQDPHFRLTRDVATKLDFYKPSILHSKFLPSLTGEGKMSSSKPKTCIFTTDTPKAVKEKINNAYTGGRGTEEEQRKLGGRPEICPVCLYYLFFFERDDEKLKQIYEDCREGKRMCGECKKELINKINEFLSEHQKKREKAKDMLDEYIVRD